VRLQRTAATGRTWQFRLNTSGNLEIIDETGGVMRLTIDTAGTLILTSGVSFNQVVGPAQFVAGSGGYQFFNNTAGLSLMTISNTGVVAFPQLPGAGGTVQAGAVNSGGAGFRMLVVPN
jgi:hypothetical protein